MSDLLQIGASGIRAYGTALATVGENVSNANTAGYTRRTVSMKEVQGTASNGIYYNGYAGFGGVRVSGIGRAWNDYQAAALRTAAGDAGRASARATWLGNAETALADDATGVGQSATAVFTAADTLAAAPGNRGNRQAFLAAIDQAASAFRTTAGALKDVSDGIAAAADTGIATVNTSLDALDKVNAAIRAGQPGTSAQASLLDQRDSILDSISGAIGIDVAIGQDGTATVKFASSGLPLVSSGASARLAASRAADGRLSLQAIVGGATQPIADAGGTLGGLAESSATVGERRQSLDTMAESFKSALNAWSAQGKDANGAAGGALLVGTGATGLTPATSDPDAVPVAGATTANGNLLALSALRTSSGVEAKWNAMVSDQGQKVASAKAEASAATARADAATTARNDDSGVDLDSEAAELVRYQQAYNASAKVIQTARETMQAILDIL